MKRYRIIYCCLAMVMVFFSVNTNTTGGENNLLPDTEARPSIAKGKIVQGNPSEKGLQDAFLGFYNLQKNGQLANDSILCFIDFTKPSYEKRLYIYDLKSDTLLYHTWVAHGKNSGVVLPTDFSNERYSNKSSLGFYKTGTTYIGKHGLSLRLIGLEQGINNNAYKRAVVVHCADYVNSSFIEKYGRLGRSFGCPALPKENYSDIIKLIKNGVCMFIYANSEEYYKNSKILDDSYSFKASSLL